jgi:integrase/recombinase XerD
MLFGHKSVKITEEHYAPWVKARQEQLAVNVRRSWTVLTAGNQIGKRKSPKRTKSA